MKFLQATQIYPAQTPVSIVPELTAFQAEMVLSNNGLLPLVEGFMNSQTTPDKIKIAWRKLNTYRRDNPLILFVADQIGLTEIQLDQLFAEGALISPDQL